MQSPALRVCAMQAFKPGEGAEVFGEQNMMYALRVTLQHLITAASTTQEPIMTYRLSSNSQPAVQTLLRIAIILADKTALVGMQQPLAAPGLANICQRLAHLHKT